MERLTKRDGMHVYTTEPETCTLCGYSWDSVSHFCENTVCKSLKDRSCPYLRVFDRLAEYEDTGLTPEQVNALAAELEAERYRHDRYVDFELAEAAELAKVKAERDELLRTIRVYGGCDFCKYETVDCDESPCHECRGWGGKLDKWEWRGVNPDGAEV